MSRRSRIAILKASEPDCLTGRLWGEDRCKAAIDAFNESLGLEAPSWVLDYHDDEIQALVEEDESELNRSYQVGISSGLDQAASLLMSEATSKFKAGQDNEARQLRCLSEDLKKLGKKAHPGVPK